MRGCALTWNADTWDRAWRFYTVPGDPAKGFQNSTMEIAAKTWNGEWWKAGGGCTAWGYIAYDHELDLFYLGLNQFALV